MYYMFVIDGMQQQFRKISIKKTAFAINNDSGVNAKYYTWHS